MFNTPVIETYLHLLRQAIGLQTPAEDSIPLETVKDMEKLLHLCQIQGTAPLVYDQLLKEQSLSSSLLKGGELLLSMKQVCMRNMMLQEEQKQLLRQAWSALDKGGASPVLLKGFGLASLYPHSHLRQGGDIDVYVGAEHYHRGAEILRNTFPAYPCFQEEEEFYKHWNVDFEHTALEMHRVSAILIHPCDMRLWKRLESEAMAHAVELDIESLRVRVPEQKWNILFVFLHSWQHFIESHSAKMQQLCDLALLLHSASLLPPRSHFLPLTSYLKTNLRYLRLTQVWQAYAYIMVHYLGLPTNECPLFTDKAEKHGEKLMQQILLGRVKTTKDKSNYVPSNILLRKLYTLRHKVADSLQTWDISPIYTLHDIIGKVLEGLGRLFRGEFNRKWE